MNIISLGGGVQSSALVVLTTQGKIDDPATHAVFADTGGEMPETLEWVARLADWSRANGGPEVVTTRRQGPGLLDYHYSDERERDVTPLCVRAMPSGGLWKRDCTIRWKIKPIERWLRDQNGSASIVQLGISYDEIHRMKPSKTKWVTNRFPLIELEFTREECRRVFIGAGLSIPPKSACWFCPLRNVGYWEWMAGSDPERLEQAGQLEDKINEWNAEAGKEPTYLTSRLKPLRQAFPPGQLPLWPDYGKVDECGGYCFT